MNERIKEFRFKAAEYANEQKPLGLMKWNEIRDAKFAELIVEECVRVAMRSVSDDEPKEAWYLIEEHFGVE